MIARIRGEHDTRWGRWRPGAAGGPAAPARAESRPQGSPRALSWRQALALMAAGAAVAIGGVAGAGAFAPGQAQLALPPSPRAWLDAYEGAAIDNPSRVCGELFAPQLAMAYGKAIRATCTSYFAQITSFSVIMRRMLQDGDTAVLELRQTVQPREWAVVLSRRPGGWQAVDLLPGDPVR
jgi:hypothetical protein